MSKFLAKYTVLLTISLLAGCVNYVEQADTAYLREDWDSAVAYYLKALKATKEPIEIQQIKLRLEEVKIRGAEYHLKEAVNARDGGDIGSAYHHAKTSYDYHPTEHTLFLLSELKVLERDRLIAEGRIALEEKNWEKAIAVLNTANAVERTNQADALLSKAIHEKETYEHEMFSEAYQEATSKLNKRDWQGAEIAYKRALGYHPSDEAKREMEFVSYMAKGEEYFAKAAQNTYFSSQAERNFKAAVSYGIDKSYVNEKLDAVALGNYRVTFHSALIAPVNPSTNDPWDGFGKNDVSLNIMANLGSYYLPGGAVSSELTKLLVNSANSGTSAPDCYIVAYIDGNTFGGSNYTNQDDYQPVWELSINLPNTNTFDPRVISIQVIDADTTDNDNVGSYQFKVSDLIKTPGIQERVLFNKDGTFMAGGILAMNISVSRF